MSTVEVFRVPTLSAARERLTLGGLSRIETLAQWVTRDFTVQAHRSIYRNADGTYGEPAYTIEFAKLGEDHAEMPDHGGPELLEALPLLLAAIADQRRIDGRMVADSGGDE